MSDSVDPVFTLVRRWAAQRGYKPTEISKQLLVSRATVAAWFAHAAMAEAPGRRVTSARRFDFTKQPPDVRSAIARCLEVPEQYLAEVSRGEHGIDESEVAQVRALGTSKGVSDYLQALTTEAFAQALSVGPHEPAEREHHRVAHLVADVDGVSAATVWPDEYGQDLYRRLYQHQVLVFGTGTPGIKEEIDRTLSLAGSTVRWQHGQDPARIVVNGKEEHAIGSLVVPHVSRSRGPRVEELLPASGQTFTNDLAVIVSNPFGGNTAIAGLWAEAFGVGHLRGEDVVRRTASAAGRRASRAVADDGLVYEQVVLESRPISTHTLDQAFQLLESGGIAGAWLLSVGVENLLSANVPSVPDLGSRPVRRYEPTRLSKRLMSTEALVVVILYGQDFWLSLAANLMARRRLEQPPGDLAATSRLRSILASGTGEVTEARDLQWIERLRRETEAWTLELREREDLLKELVRAREAEALPTITLSLPSPDMSYKWIRLTDSGTGRDNAPLRVSRDASVADIPIDNAIFVEDFDYFLRIWVDMAARVIARAGKCVSDERTYRDTLAVAAKHRDRSLANRLLEYW